MQGASAPACSDPEIHNLLGCFQAWVTGRGHAVNGRLENWGHHVQLMFTAAAKAAARTLACNLHDLGNALEGLINGMYGRYVSMRKTFLAMLSCDWKHRHAQES